jgi:hypothetical protein
MEKKLLDFEKNNNNKIEYKNDLYYSRVFNNDSYLKYIMNWISPDKKIYFNLIYNLAFGNTTKSFHNYCDNKGPTLIVVYATSGYYFGGYTTENWDCSNTYKKDANAFIFSLNNNKYAKASNDNAIYCASNYGPTFGGGHDLYIADKCNENSNNNNYTNSTYNFGSSYYLNGGNCSFQVSRIEVYEGMTLEEIANQLEKTLRNDLSGHGYFIAQKSIEYGVDPFIATAIMMHETGCGQNQCSSLARNCYNFGGQKGPGCGAYRRYYSIDEGLEGMIANLYRNYYAYGLTTVEQIGPKYAESDTWVSKINWYVNKIKTA